MAKMTHEIMGLLTVKGGSVQGLSFGFVAPDAMYSIMPSDALPDDWEYIADTLEKDTEYEVIGALVRTDEETDTGQQAGLFYDDEQAVKAKQEAQEG